MPIRLSFAGSTSWTRLLLISYLENDGLGAAIAFGHPYFHLSYNKKRTVKIGRRRERIEVPSDFAGLLRLNYSDYEDLFLQFAMKFPVFLQDRGLAGPRPRTTR